MSTRRANANASVSVAAAAEATVCTVSYAQRLEHSLQSVPRAAVSTSVEAAELAGWGLPPAQRAADTFMEEYRLAVRDDDSLSRADQQLYALRMRKMHLEPEFYQMLASEDDDEQLAWVTAFIKRRGALSEDDPEHINVRDRAQLRRKVANELDILRKVRELEVAF